MPPAFSPTGPSFGAHVSIAGGHHRALERATALGCEHAQVFTKNNLQWFARPLDEAGVAAWGEARECTGLAAVFAHAGYLINLAGEDPENLDRSRRSLLDELERCRRLGLPFIVLHPGSHRGRGAEAGLEQVLASLDWIFARFDGATRIALEFTAGQGDALGRSIEEIAWLLDHSAHRDRLAVCLDTCHLFAAGYDLRTAADVDRFVRGFRRQIPWENVVCLHANDSKGDLGSRIDRHEVLGRGRLGGPCFEAIIAHPAFRGLPFCLETPKGKDNINDRTTLAALKAIRDQRPERKDRPPGRG
ncbi:MAG: deoxyribonuclease IV [Puniceicoccaceae bacterium]|nr:MAG: deoxyribonuclease IV [Puniceicoccaceae bacterium]